MQKPQITFTKEGYEKLHEERKELVEKRKDAVEHLKKAREMGDLSENGYYKASRAKLSFIDRRLTELTYLLRYGVIAEASQAGIVMIGSSVTITSNNTDTVYHIVGRYEANPALGKISDVSPLGKKLMGRKTGEMVEFDTPSGKQTITIVNVS